MNVFLKDKKFLGRDIGAVKLEITGSRGSYLIDEKGKEYIDFVMGWNVGNVGWSQKEITDKIKEFSGPTYVNPYYLYKPWADLAELLVRISPGKLAKVFRTTGGTESVEMALQAAMSHTKRYKFVSISGAYHGHSMGAMSIGDLDFEKWYPNLMKGCVKINPPLNENAAREIEKILSKKDVAAFISEPIICNLGVEIPEKKFFEIVQSTCKRSGTVLIIDEVATGFGRTGKLFASEHYDLEPDILCLGKGLTGGYAALGATLMTDEVAKSFEFPFSFYSTFGWHPLNVHATLANLNYLLPRKEIILANVNKMSQYFESRLKKMNLPKGTRIKIKGLAIGVCFEEEGLGVKLVNQCMEKGLLFSELDAHHITFFPALNIDRKTAEIGLNIFESCL